MHVDPRLWELGQQGSGGSSVVKVNMGQQQVPHGLQTGPQLVQACLERRNGAGWPGIDKGQAVARVEHVGGDGARHVLKIEVDGGRVLWL